MYVDKFKMDQVIRNLISNALKFTPSGGSVSVTVSFGFDGLYYDNVFCNFSCHQKWEYVC